MTEVFVPWKPAWNTDLIPCTTDDPMAMPIEHLEARICELAGHLTAAACKFLLLLADFDARRGWASWEMPSCAAWLSWKCQIAAGKVRALTRIATPQTEHDLVAMAAPMTANQLERFARAHRRVCRNEREDTARRRMLTWRYAAGGVPGGRPPGQHSRGPALRRAARERDRYRCRFPGCESRRVDLHHIVFWSSGGHTRLENIICLCKRHHAIVHDKGIIIAAAADRFAFCIADGTPIEASPPLPASTGGAITNCHDAVITPSTIIPPHSGERLDLHLAIWTCFANARIDAARREAAAVPS